MMFMRYMLLLCVLLLACTKSDAAPSEPAIAHELSGTCDPATPPGCYHAGEAALIASVEGAVAWFAASNDVCPTGMEVWLCDGCMAKPDSCVPISGGQPSAGGHVMQTFCCTMSGAPAPVCQVIPCPYPQSQCYDGVCTPSATCTLSHQQHNGQPCKGGADFICSMKSPGGPILCGSP